MFLFADPGSGGEEAGPSGEGLGLGRPYPGCCLTARARRAQSGLVRPKGIGLRAHFWFKLKSDSSVGQGEMAHDWSLTHSVTWPKLGRRRALAITGAWNKKPTWSRPQP